jgi:ATP-dependent DNA ligase
MERFGCPAVSLSEPFDDGRALVRVAEQRGPWGVVSKRCNVPYRSGDCRDWLKVLTALWLAANRNQWACLSAIKRKARTRRQIGADPTTSVTVPERVQH